MNAKTESQCALHKTLNNIVVSDNGISCVYSATNEKERAPEE